MVSGNDKYWFENDDKEKSEVGQGESGIAEENEKEDLFGFDASDTLDSSVTSAPSEKITSPLDSANVPPSDKPVFPRRRILRTFLIPMKIIIDRIMPAAESTKRT